MSTTHPAPIHPVATANRVAKAQRIVDFMDANPRLFAEVSATEVAEFSRQTWLLINHAMGEVRPVSQLTIATVIGILAGRSL